MDVGAKADIYAIIDKLAVEGSAILVISSELPEVLGVADRIIVMQGGRIRGELAARGGDRRENPEPRHSGGCRMSTTELGYDRRTSRRALRAHASRAIGVQNVSLLLALAALIAFIGVQNSNFFYASNIETIGTTVAIVGVLAVVQTVVMLLGGLDISVGSQAGLTSVVSAMVFMATGSALAGIAAALAARSLHRAAQRCHHHLRPRQRGHRDPRDLRRLPGRGQSRSRTGAPRAIPASTTSSSSWRGATSSAFRC